MYCSSHQFNYLSYYTRPVVKVVLSNSYLVLKAIVPIETAP